MSVFFLESGLEHHLHIMTVCTSLSYAFDNQGSLLVKKPNTVYYSVLLINECERQITLHLTLCFSIFVVHIICN